MEKFAVFSSTGIPLTVLELGCLCIYQGVLMLERQRLAAPSGSAVSCEIKSMKYSGGMLLCRWTLSILLTANTG